MARQSRGSAPRRPSAPPARAAAPQQTRSASTTAMPGTGLQKAPGQSPAAPQAGQSQGPGLFGQMASTAAGVAVGSSIGHALGGFFGGGSSASAPVEQDMQSAQTQTQSYEQPRACGDQIGQFRSCMDQNQGDLNVCGWYLDALKACQQAASKY